METLSTALKAEIAFVAIFNFAMGLVMVLNFSVMIVIMHKLDINEKELKLKNIINILKGGKNDKSDNR